MNEAPLKDLRVVVTRPEQQAGSFGTLLSKQGAVPVMIPAIKIEPIWEVAGLEGALNDVERYSWIVFTSVNGVDTIKNRLAQMGGSFDLLAACRVAAIGPATADALKASGIHAEFVPEEYVGEELGDGIDVKPGDRVLLPRAKGSRPALPNLLAQRGARVDEFSVYKAVAAKWDPGVVGELEIGVDALTFTSPSTVRNFIQGGRDQGLEPLRLPGKPAVACIGPITAAAATEAGYQVTVEAEEYTIPGLVGALCRHFQRKNN